MEINWRRIIANQNWYYLQICSAYHSYWNKYEEWEHLKCLPLELYEKILYLSNDCLSNCSKGEIRENIKEFQKKGQSYSEFWGEFVENKEMEYIQVLESQDYGYSINTWIYVLSGFLFVHGKSYLRNAFSDDELIIIYHLLFDEDVVDRISYRKLFLSLRRITEINNKRKEDMVEHILIIVVDFFDVAFRLLRYDDKSNKGLWELKNEDKKILYEKIELMITKYQLKDNRDVMSFSLSLSGKE